MSEPSPARCSHKAAWTMSLLAVPVVYVLTLPVVMLVCTTNWPTKGPLKPTKSPEWSRTYGVPWVWLRESTPLRPALDAYYRWWWREVAGIDLRF